MICLPYNKDNHRKIKVVMVVGIYTLQQLSLELKTYSGGLLSRDLKPLRFRVGKNGRIRTLRGRMA